MGWLGKHKGRPLVWETHEVCECFIHILHPTYHDDTWLCCCHINCSLHEPSNNIPTADSLTTTPRPIIDHHINQQPPAHANLWHMWHAQLSTACYIDHYHYILIAHTIPAMLIVPSTAHCPHPNFPLTAWCRDEGCKPIHTCFQLQTSLFTIYSHRRGKMLPPHLPPQSHQAWQQPHLSVMCLMFDVHRHLFIIWLHSLQPSMRMLPPHCHSQLHI